MRAGDHYELLGVLPSAGPADIRSAYRRTVARIHPDHARDVIDLEARNRMTAAVNQAHRVLRDPVLRAGYDQRMGYGGPRSATPRARRLRLRVRTSGRAMAERRLGGRLSDLRRFGAAAPLARSAVRLRDVAWSTRYGQWLVVLGALVTSRAVAGLVLAGPVEALVVIALTVGVAAVLARGGQPTPLHDAETMTIAAGAIGSRATHRLLVGIAEIGVRLWLTRNIDA
jgi:hypothetical protein